MTNENIKTYDQLIFGHIFRKKHFKNNLKNFMSESLNATSTPLRFFKKICQNNPKFVNLWFNRDYIVNFSDFEVNHYTLMTIKLFEIQN
jgi:hypothetical protein